MRTPVKKEDSTGEALRSSGVEVDAFIARAKTISQAAPAEEGSSLPWMQP